MSARRRMSTKGLSGLTALMVLFALVVPLSGAALAAHIVGISITPTTDSAPAGTCNAFTVSVLEDGPGNQQRGAEGETVDVIVTDTDADNNGSTTGGANESAVSFCDPAGTQQEAGQGSDEFGPNDQLALANSTGRNNTDDNIATSQQGEVAVTDNAGQITFGITSTETGTFSVTVFVDEDRNNTATGELTATATKTFTPGSTPPPAAQCGDGQDNDGDGLVDFPNDQGCTSADDNTEAPNPGPAQCQDNVDNDGDGLIDHPNDPGCASPKDETEAGDTADPTVVKHARTIKITRIRHIFLPGKDKPALLVKGVVTAPDFPDCATNVPVKVQIRAGGEWITRKTDTTNARGVFKVLIRDVAARYRARATRFEIVDPDANVVHVCLKATDRRRHGHR